MHVMKSELPYSQCPLSHNAFVKIRDYFKSKSGINIPEHKIQLIVSRLSGHMRTLGFDDFDAYIHHVIHRDDEAAKTAVDLLTTNETYFFREAEHFNYLAREILPSLKQRPARVWCAAASSGEEPYSLAMTLTEHLGLDSWELVASDISNRMLERAYHGLYPLQRIDNLPENYLRKYCRKGMGEYEGMFRVNLDIRNRVDYINHNLLNSAQYLGYFDVIFVRNVLIYFDNQVKQQVLQNLYNQLKPGGWLITSHSESLLGCSLPLTTIKPSIYRKPFAI